MRLFMVFINITYAIFCNDHYNKLLSIFPSNIWYMRIELVLIYRNCNLRLFNIYNP